MPLSPGTRLGPYEILSAIGAGGMGEVYRARDTKLDRDVAIKVLPEAFAADPERIARFQREAKTLAALNHPHIAAIYGIEDGPAEAGPHVRALVMELVEGEDLSQRIARGPIPVDEALPIAKQIAEALEAAHEQGIIHRDLKPANIKVTPDGAVKVLDFGLAKLNDPNVSNAPNSPNALSLSPTITSPAMMTGAGMILGTASYMSPEQARGKAVDKRADIWAFGCVLFEMLTGKRAFAGDDVSDVMASVLAREPEWAGLPARVSPALGTVIKRCLQKDPKQRVRDVGDVRLALNGAFETAAPPATASATSATPRGRLAWILSAVALLGMVALAIPATRYLRQTPSPETRLDIVTPATDQPTSFALSPDGRQVVVVSRIVQGVSNLWLMDGARTSRFTFNAFREDFSVWSPDGTRVVFRSTRTGDLCQKLASGAGVEERLVASDQNKVGTSWSADGRFVMYISADPQTNADLWVLPMVGDRKPWVLLKTPFREVYGAFSPDGRWVAYHSNESGRPEV